MLSLRPSVKKIVPGSYSDDATAKKESAYLGSVWSTSAYVRDSYSGEQLDIRKQCVGMSVSDGAGAVEAIGYVQRKLTKSRPLEPTERVRVQLDSGNALTWLDGVVEQEQAGDYSVRINDTPFALVDAAAQQTFDAWIEDGAKQTAFNASDFQDQQVELELTDQQWCKRVLGGVYLECERDGEVKLQFATVALFAAAAKHPEKSKSRFSLQRTAQLVPRLFLCHQPVLITGEAGCGKSTFTKQYHALSAQCARYYAGSWMVPLLVPVIELAKTVQEQSIDDADADILEAHLMAQHTNDAPFLLQMRAQCRLLVLLDGMDEAGDCRATLESYVSCRLTTEVQLLVTSRHEGIEAKNLFNFFAHAQVQPLSGEKQVQFIQGRFWATPLEGSRAQERITNFAKQLMRNTSFTALAKNPLLMNLLVVEYMHHERVKKSGDRNIYFVGRCVPRQKEYLGSFPGEHKEEWDRVITVVGDKSVACIFSPEDDYQWGKHAEDPKNLGKCFCESFLYYDAPEELQRDVLELIMDNDNLHLGEGLPEVGKKVEAFITVPKWTASKWWVCTVREVSEPEEDSEDEPKVLVSFDGLGRVLQPAWLKMEDINQTGQRRTTQRKKQAPFGCKWFAKWTERVFECEADGQKALVVYKAGKTGVKTFEGLGASQLKEVEYLEQHFRYSKKKNFREIDTVEFEKENTMNRAYVYKSAIQRMVEQHADKGDKDTLMLDYLLPFMQELAFASHTQAGGQFRTFDTAFVNQNLLRAGRWNKNAHPDVEEFRALWTGELLPDVRASTFPLLVCEPNGANDVYQFSHLSFQEYLCASRLVEQMQQQEDDDASIAVCAAFVDKAGLQRIESLLGANRFQVIVQMTRELLVTDTSRAEAFASCFLPESEDATIRVKANLSTASAATTLLTLVSCRTDPGTKLRLAKSGLNSDALCGWKNCLQRWDQPCRTVTEIDVSSNDLKASGAKALKGVLKLHGSFKKVEDRGRMAKFREVVIEGLTSLNLSSNQIGAEGAKHIVEALKENFSELVAINILINDIGVDQAIELVKTMKKRKTLKTLCGFSGDEKTLNLSRKGLSAGCAVLVANEVKSNEALATITFGEKEAVTMTSTMIEADFSNKLRSYEAYIVAAFVPRCGAMKRLNIGANGILNREAGKTLGDMLKANTVLKELDMSNSGEGIFSDGPAFAQELAHGIRANGALTYLNLAHNNLRAEGAKHIAEAMRVNWVLEKLNISDNNIQGVEAGIALADALAENTALRHLNLSNNGCGSECIQAFAVGLRVNRTLESLHIGSNSIATNTMADIIAVFTSKPTMKVLCEVPLKDKTLSELDVSGKSLGSDSALIVSHYLKENQALVKCDLSNNNLNYGIDGDEAATPGKLISDAIAANTVLKELNLSGNYLKASFANEFAAGLRANAVLSELDIGNNMMGSEEMAALEDLFEEKMDSGYAVHLRL